MKFSKAFRTELERAIRLSLFITLIVFGILYAQSRNEEVMISRRDRPETLRKVASPDRPMDRACIKGNDGKLYRYSRATPPYEKIPCE